MRKEGDLQPKYEMQIYFRSMLHSWNNSGLRSGSQCFHPASVDTFPAPSGPKTPYESKQQGLEDGLQDRFQAKRLKFCLGQEDPLEKEMQPTPVFLPGKFHGQRSLAGRNPWCCKESDTTEPGHTLSTQVLSPVSLSSSSYMLASH